MSDLCTPLKIYIILIIVSIISIIIVSLEGIRKNSSKHRIYLFIAMIIAILSKLICAVLIGTAMLYLCKRNINICWFLLISMVFIYILLFMCVPRMVEHFTSDGEHQVLDEERRNNRKNKMQVRKVNSTTTIINQNDS